MKKMIALMIVTAMAVAANAAVVTYGWEDGGDVLGTYGLVTASNDSENVHSGNSALKLVDGGSGTPQAYVGWITGLQDGDQVSASFWAYDTTPEGENPKGRIWGHYTTDDADITVYGGSASGNGAYSDGPGWTYLEYTWTFVADGGDSYGLRDGLVIEGRTYTALGDTIWYDDLTITAPDHATIVVPVPEPATISLIGAGALAFIRRRR